ncbi:hypothetical protein ALI144C_45895 [Actinosynnema sp. ALI-1.44]|uniref:hypothetical protein n=1 Tax=Actinosynnema sp. ALI-1.44 TaxID=1933779 RepID=UPI00097C8F6B|nr:hypothetical protein [Actinosynnema sp. ALI-1.44]ONI73255.1 hypothetical protein ALI144C_45895 [Actinosynnema sp. ALI-1.44]
MTTRYAYTLFELRKRDSRVTHYEIVRQTQVIPAAGGIEALASGLTAWALEFLLPGNREPALYSAELTTLDEDDEPDDYIHTVSICQSGSDQFSVWPDPRRLISA